MHYDFSSTTEYLKIACMVLFAAFAIASFSFATYRKNKIREKELDNIEHWLDQRAIELDKEYPKRKFGKRYY